MATAAIKRTGGPIRQLTGVLPQFSFANVEKGVQPDVVLALIEGRVFTAEEIDRVIPRRTLARRLAAREPLRVVEGDALGRLVRVTAMATRAFGDDDRAGQWMRSGNPALGGRVPLDMARTDAGAREVEAVLDRFMRGDYA